MKEGKLIAFFGIDGCGKTTLIQKIKEKLEKEGGKTKIVYMGLGDEFNLPFLLAIMKFLSFIKQRSKKDEKTLRKYNYRKRSFFWVLGQYSELWMRYKKAKKSSKEKIILFDRFFYDGLILGGRFSYNFFKIFTPKPDKSFLIYASPKTISKRKNEADVGDIEKYYKNAEKLQNDFKIIKINNVGNIDKIADEIYSYIKE